MASHFLALINRLIELPSPSGPCMASYSSIALAKQPRDSGPGALGMGEAASDVTYGRTVLSGQERRRLLWGSHLVSP